MRGTVRKRCQCPAAVDSRGRRKACPEKHGSWGYTVDLGPGPNPDGEHVARRQLTRFGFATKKDAEKALAEVIDASSRGVGVAVNSTLAAGGLHACKVREKSIFKGRVGISLLGARPGKAMNTRRNVPRCCQRIGIPLGTTKQSPTLRSSR